MKLTELRVRHLDRDINGNKLEPEQQTVDQIGTAAVTVNLGQRPGYLGGPAGGRNEAMARAAAEISARGGLLSTARIERSVSADTAAKEATMTCFNCKNWDPVVTKHSLFVGAVHDDAYTALAKGYLQSEMFTGMSPVEAIAEAEAMARASGICGAMQDDEGRNMISPIHFRCHRFRPRSWLAKKLMASKYDEIMMAARGGVKKLMVGAAGGSGTVSPSEKK